MSSADQKPTDQKPTNKQELGLCIQTVLDAVPTGNQLLTNFAIGKLNGMFETLPDNWVKDDG